MSRTRELQHRWQTVMMENYGTPPVALDHGRGATVWDVDGREYLDLIAGIASLAGMTFLDPNTRRPSQPVNVLQIHGTADEAVPYAGGALLAGLPVVALFPGAVTTVQTWAGFNGCQGPQWDAQPSMNLDLAVAGLDTTVLRYTNCPAGGAVELWSINGGLHAPTFFSGTTNSEYSARVIDWLLAHPKP